VADTVFHVIGPGRGGTSLLFGLLDAHPDCEMVGERLSIGLLMAKNAAHDDLPLPDRTIRRVDDFLAACYGAARSSPAKLWGHKSTTEQIFGLNFPERLEERFDPEAYFIEAVRDSPIIFIIRDGRTCVRSKVRRTGQSVETAIRGWKYSVALLSAFRARHGKVLQVRMEDLVTHPADALRSICAFLGLEYTDAMLVGTKSLKMRSDYRQPGFDLSVIEVGEPQAWQAELEPELSTLGYTTPSSS
jgi:hypothetical protein